MGEMLVIVTPSGRLACAPGISSWYHLGFSSPPPYQELGVSFEITGPRRHGQLAKSSFSEGVNYIITQTISRCGAVRRKTFVPPRHMANLARPELALKPFLGRRRNIVHRTPRQWDGANRRRQEEKRDNCHFLWAPH